MPKMVNGVYTADFSTCNSESACDQEFQEWSYNTCMGAFCKDKGIVYEKNSVEAMYDQEYSQHSGLFLSSISIDGAGRAAYYGTDKALKRRIKDTNSLRSSTAKNIRVRTNIDTQPSVSQQAWDTVNDYGYNKYSNAGQKNIKELAQQIENGTLTGQAKQDAITRCNQEYGTQFTVDTTPKQMKDEANSTTDTKTYTLNQTARNGIQDIINYQTAHPQDSATTNQMIDNWNAQYGQSGIKLKHDASAQTLYNSMNNTTKISVGQRILWSNV